MLAQQYNLKIRGLWNEKHSLPALQRRVLSVLVCKIIESFWASETIKGTCSINCITFRFAGSRTLLWRAGRLGWG